MRVRNFDNLNFANFERLIIAGGEYDATREVLEAGLASIDLAGGRLVVGDRTINLNNLKASAKSQVSVIFSGNQGAQIVLGSDNKLSLEDVNNMTLYISEVTATHLPTSTEEDDVRDIILRGATSIPDGTRVRVLVSESLNLPNEVFISGEFFGGNLELVYTFGSIENIQLPPKNADLADEQRALAAFQRAGATPEEQKILVDIVVLAQTQPELAAKRIAQITGITTTQVSNQLTSVAGLASAFAKARAVSVSTGVGGVNGPDNQIKFGDFNVWLDFSYNGRKPPNIRSEYRLWFRWLCYTYGNRCKI